MLALSSKFRKLTLLLVLGLLVLYLQIVITERQQYVQAAIKRRQPTKSLQNQQLDDPEYEPGKLLIKSMLQHAWSSYRRHAWGSDELSPLSKEAASFFSSSHTLALTMVDSLDTLLICGLHEEYKEAVEFVLSRLSFDKDGVRVNVFESNIRIVGGLLAAFALTGDGRLAGKAFDLAQRYVSAFKNDGILPERDIDLMGHVKMQASSDEVTNSCITAEAGTLMMEWAYMSYIVKDKTLRNKAYAIIEKLSTLKGQYDGLLPKVARINYNGVQSGRYTLGGMVDSYYEYLLKFWLQSGKQDRLHKELLLRALPSLETYLTKEIDGQVYLIEQDVTGEIPRQEHLACFAGGFFALAGKELKDEHYVRLGAKVTESCYRMYIQQPTGLGPEAARVPELEPIEAHWIMRPEVVESIFVLYRVTGDPKYRQWGLNIAEAIQRHSKIDIGMAGVKDVTVVPVINDDRQQSFFLAETIKYLYLLFCDKKYISLDEFVFNTEAHPLPIIRSGL